MKRLIIFVFLAMIANLALGQDKPLDAKASDPKTMGWMTGFPPAPQNRLFAHDGSFFKFPALRYSVVHMREFMPTVNVPRGQAEQTPFHYRLDSRIDSLTFTATGTSRTMTWVESLAENYTDGILILHKGEVVYERYFGELTEDQVHAVMSLTKSFTGTLAAILVAEGMLDENKPVAWYVPELKTSAFGDATVRQVMDMTTALKYSENYADPQAEVWDFTMAGNPLVKLIKPQGPIGFYEYLEKVEKQGEHGRVFGYKTVNADALGWIIARATGRSVAELLSERIWRKLGMEQDAYYQVDVLGVPFAGGGFNAGLRDLARFGELIRNDGMWLGQQIIPAAAVLDIKRGGDKKAFARSEYTKLKGWSYRNMWWMLHNRNNAFAARGVHGQTIYIDPVAEMVIVRLASHPVAGNAANDPFSLPAYEAVAKYLMQQK